MGLCVILIDEVAVVGTYELDVILFRQLYQYTVHLLLQREGLAVGALVRVFYLVALQLKVEIITPYFLVPLYGLACSLYVVGEYLLRYLSTYAGRADDKVLMVLFQVLMVCTWPVVVTINP